MTRPKSPKPPARLLPPITLDQDEHTLLLAHIRFDAARTARFIHDDEEDGFKPNGKPHPLQPQFTRLQNLLNKFGVDPRLFLQAQRRTVLPGYRAQTLPKGIQSWETDADPSD